MLTAVKERARAEERRDKSQNREERDKRIMEKNLNKHHKMYCGGKIKRRDTLKNRDCLSLYIFYHLEISDSYL